VNNEFLRLETLSQVYTHKIAAIKCNIIIIMYGAKREK